MPTAVSSLRRERVRQPSHEPGLGERRPPRPPAHSTRCVLAQRLAELGQRRHRHRLGHPPAGRWWPALSEREGIDGLPAVHGWAGRPGRAALQRVHLPELRGRRPGRRRALPSLLRRRACAEHQHRGAELQRPLARAQRGQWAPDRRRRPGLGRGQRLGHALWTGSGQRSAPGHPDAGRGGALHLPSAAGGQLFVATAGAVRAFRIAQPPPVPSTPTPTPTPTTTPVAPPRAPIRVGQLALGHSAHVRRGRAWLTLRCLGPGTCSGVVGLRLRVGVRHGHHVGLRQLSIGRARFRLVAGWSGVRSIRLDATARHALVPAPSPAGHRRHPPGRRRPADNRPRRASRLTPGRAVIRVVG